MTSDHKEQPVFWSVVSGVEKKETILLKSIIYKVVINSDKFLNHPKLSKTQKYEFLWGENSWWAKEKQNTNLKNSMELVGGVVVKEKGQARSNCPN